MPLSDSAIRSAKPTEKPFRLNDTGGLYVEVSPAGGKLWRLKYRIAGNFALSRCLLATLTTYSAVGIVANMKAELITRFRDIADDGTGLEMVVWRVPDPVPPSGHRFKYRLVCVESGRRVVGFDNERGKGDHKHFGDREEPYTFVDVDRLIDDFIQEVERWKSEH